MKMGVDRSPVLLHQPQPNTVNLMSAIFKSHRWQDPDETSCHVPETPTTSPQLSAQNKRLRILRTLKHTPEKHPPKTSNMRRFLDRAENEFRSLQEKPNSTSAVKGPDRSSGRCDCKVGQNSRPIHKVANEFKFRSWSTRGCFHHRMTYHCIVSSIHPYMCSLTPTNNTQILN